MFPLLTIVFLVAAALSPAGSGAQVTRQIDPGALSEANRLLEEELKVAARPQVYVVLDLTRSLVLIKGRGIELSQIPIVHWRQSGDSATDGVYRLRTRPPVSRPKAAPSDTLSPIELDDMPETYELQFDPLLVIVVSPPAGERFWSWAVAYVREWWVFLSAQFGVKATTADAANVRLHLTLSSTAAQSLAWSLTDGMTLLIGRTLP
jgi:hypothetical protein